MQQLNQVLARVKGLVIEDKEVEGRSITEETLSDYFGLNTDQLLSLKDEAFINEIQKKGFQPEELNTLAYFIDEYAGLQDELSEQLMIYRHYISLVEFLEKEYQFVSFDHIARKKLLQSQLKNL